MEGLAEDDEQHRARVERARLAFAGSGFTSAGSSSFCSTFAAAFDFGAIGLK